MERVQTGEGARAQSRAAAWAQCRHAHAFSQGNPAAERRTRWVMWLTLIVMVAEIVGGWAFNSMALLADGWHMSSHALALGLAVFAYRMAARFAGDRRFSFGTWKIEILGGYTSALMLLGVALMMAWHSVERLLVPLPISYDAAIGTATLGLAVNLVSAWMLKDSEHHHHHHHHGHHGHDHDHDHDHGGRMAGVAGKLATGAQHSDLNMRAAYLHVLADAATSILAIMALFGGKWWGADWLDPVMGIVGAVLVAVWAKGLLADCSRVLLDAEMDKPLVQRVRRTLETSAFSARLEDLHVWRVAHDRYACIAALSVADARGSSIRAEDVRHLLGVYPELVHVTVEINHR